MISFACSSCSQRYTVPDDKAGKRTKCARCSQSTTIPGPEQDWELVDESPLEKGEGRPTTQARCPACAVGELKFKAVPSGSKAGEARLLEVVYYAECGHVVTAAPTEAPTDSSPRPRPPAKATAKTHTDSPRTAPAVIAFLLALFCFAAAFVINHEADKADAREVKTADSMNSVRIGLALSSGSGAEPRMREPKRADRSLVWVSLIAGTVLFGVSLVCATQARANVKQESAVEDH